MSISEASKQSGLSPAMITRAAKASQFVADKPRGNRGGWVIDQPSFALWLVRRVASTGNTMAQAEALNKIFRMANEARRGSSCEARITQP